MCQSLKLTILCDSVGLGEGGNDIIFTNVSIVSCVGGYNSWQIDLDSY